MINEDMNIEKMNIEKMNIIEKRVYIHSHLHIVDDETLNWIYEKLKEAIQVQSDSMYPQPGCMKGTFKLNDDLDEPIEDFKDYK